MVKKSAKHHKTLHHYLQEHNDLHNHKHQRKHHNHHQEHKHPHSHGQLILAYYKHKTSTMHLPVLINDQTRSALTATNLQLAHLSTISNQTTCTHEGNTNVSMSMQQQEDLARLLNQNQ